MKIENLDMNQLVGIYQDLLIEEKRELLYNKNTREVIREMWLKKEKESKKPTPYLKSIIATTCIAKGELSDFDLKIIDRVSIETWNKARRQMETLSREENEKWKEISQKCVEIRNKVIIEMLPFVEKKCSYMKQKSTLEFGDMIGEGTLGVLRAMEKFDKKANVDFKNYAMFWIEARVKKLVDLMTQVRRTGSLKKVYNDAMREVERMENERNGQVSMEEVAESLGISEDLIEASMAKNISLNAKIGEENDSEYGDIYEAEQDDPSEFEEKNFQILLNKVILKMNKTSKEVAIFRFDLHSDGVENFTAISFEDAFFRVKNNIARRMISDLNA